MPAPPPKFEWGSDHPDFHKSKWIRSFASSSDIKQMQKQELTYEQLLERGESRKQREDARFAKLDATIEKLDQESAKASDKVKAAKANDKLEATRALRPDIQTAKDEARFTWGAGLEITSLEATLFEGELVRHLSPAKIDGGTGIVVLTDRRIFTTRLRLFSDHTEDLPLSKVSSVEVRTGFSGTTLEVHASGNTVKIEKVEAHIAEAIARAVREQISAPPTAASPATPDVMEQLKKLGELHTAGVINDAEFEEKKADLLGRI